MDDSDLDALLPGDPDALVDAPVVRGTVRTAHGDVARVDVRGPRGTRAALLPASEWPAARPLRPGDTHTFLVLPGPRPTVSATTPELVRALFAGVSPEVRTGRVRIMAVARAAGIRSKVAVAATVADLDPVAPLVGPRANRVRAVAAALGGERIDVVAWHPDRERYLVAALAPAAVTRVVFDDAIGLATAFAPVHQMAAAVGAGGLNSALAGQLVGTKVVVEPD